MSVPRLTFLYPHLFRAGNLRESVTAYRPFRSSEARHRKAGFSSSVRRKEETYAQRYGPAAEPQLPPPSQPPVSKDLGRDGSLAGVIEKEVKAPIPKPEDKKAEQPPPKEAAKSKEDSEKSATSTSTAKPNAGDKPQKLDASESQLKEAIVTTNQKPSTKPLDTVLKGEEPIQSTPEEHKPPHLQASRYVHHFDTYTIVRDLQKGGFTQDQSVTLMKAVRMLLAQNLDVAHEGLVSKSDVENVHSPFPPLPAPDLSRCPPPAPRNPPV